MPLIPVAMLDNPRLGPYRNVKDRELARQGGLFLAEGHHLVMRLLASDFPTDSVLVDERKLRLIEASLRPDIPVYVAPPGLVDQVVGYPFHAGVIAVGRRKTEMSVDALMQRLPGRALLVVCPDLRSTENLGSIIRTAAGFGADALIVGEQSCDPFYRQCVRVSMGTIFSLPIIQSKNLLADLASMRKRWNIELIATVLDSNAERLADAKPPERMALMLGSEDQGLTPEIVALASRRVTLPMSWKTDSLNVAIAAGIFLYHFTKERM
ncbi:MAG TPA: RNA methyltransferase [Tepidisphaeraceae bacterium]|jgi:tRNA G18 (ribose-2'-O)-methylase SpoU